MDHGRSGTSSCKYVKPFVSAAKPERDSHARIETKNKRSQRARDRPALSGQIRGLLPFFRALEYPRPSIRANAIPLTLLPHLMSEPITPEIVSIASSSTLEPLRKLQKIVTSWKAVITSWPANPCRPA